VGFGINGFVALTQNGRRTAGKRNHLGGHWEGAMSYSNAIAQLLSIAK
jgi:hypothetical protein